MSGYFFQFVNSIATYLVILIQFSSSNSNFEKCSNSTAKDWKKFAQSLKCKNTWLGYGSCSWSLSDHYSFRRRLRCLGKKKGPKETFFSELILKWREHKNKSESYFLNVVTVLPVYSNIRCFDLYFEVHELNPQQWNKLA